MYCISGSPSHSIYSLYAGSPVLTGTSTITLIVDDINDNLPTFAFKTYHATIPENAATGTDVLLVNATDVDDGLNAVVR